MEIIFKPVGYVRHNHESVPRHWSVSDIEGRLEIDPWLSDALADTEVGDRIVVLFHFNKSPEFGESFLKQTPPGRDEPKGVFDICSPVRPNALGLSVVEVLAKDECVLTVSGIDMLDGTPILDIKPHVTGMAG